MVETVCDHPLGTRGVKERESDKGVDLDYEGSSDKTILLILLSRLHMCFLIEKFSTSKG